MKNFQGIQAMRGVAALMVAIGHVATAKLDIGGPSPALVSLTGMTTAGVDIFFVISGFIIATSATEAGKREGRAAMFSFIMKRLLRIYPIYWAVLIAAVVNFSLIHPGYDGPRLTLDAWLLSNRENVYVPQAWTLTYEMCFYLAVAAALMISPGRIYALLFSGLGAVLLCNVAFKPQLALLMPLTLEFGLGVAIAWLTGRGLRISPTLGVILAAGLFGVAWFQVANGVWMEGFERVLTYGVGSALLVYAVISAEFKGAKFPGWSVYFGSMSYSFYLWHVVVFSWASHFMYSDAVPRIALMALWLLTAIAISSASYELIERPMMRLHRAPRKDPLAAP